MCDCWKEQPSERPSFERILDRLNKIIAHDEETSKYLDMAKLDCGRSSVQSSRRGSGSSGKDSNYGEETEECRKSAVEEEPVNAVGDGDGQLPDQSSSDISLRYTLVIESIV